METTNDFAIGLDEDDTYYLRKRIGVFDRGAIVAPDEIVKSRELTKGYTITRKYKQIYMKIYVRYLYEVKYKNLNDPETKKYILEQSIDCLDMNKKYKIILKKFKFLKIKHLILGDEVQLNAICELNDIDIKIIKRALMLLGLNFKFEPPIKIKTNIMNIGLNNKSEFWLEKIGILFLEDLVCYTIEDLELFGVPKDVIENINETLKNLNQKLSDQETKNERKR